MTIRTAILGLLSWKPLSGYDLKKIMAGSSSMYWSGNNNQIYTTLIQLHREGLVTQEVQVQDSLPAKKVYSISAEGRAALRMLVMETPEPFESRSSFLVQLAWGDVLSEEELDNLLGKYEEEVRIQHLMQQEKARRAAAPRRTRRETYLWEMINENILSVYERELEWVRRLRDGLKDKGA